MSIFTAFLTILAITAVIGGVALLLAMLAERQKERLAAPLMISVCPECGIRFGLTVVGYINAIDILLSVPAEGNATNSVDKSTVICFDCPRCGTGWKCCENVLVKAAAPETHCNPMQFSWVMPVLKEKFVYNVVWKTVWLIKRTAVTIRRGNRHEIISFIGQKEITLYLSWLFGLALWSVSLPSCPLLYSENSYGQRVELGFAFMVLGLVSGVIACFRCPEKRFAGIAIAINCMPIAYLVLWLCGLLEFRAWYMQME